jgi:hypothetical protein
MYDLLDFCEKADPCPPDFIEEAIEEGLIKQ